MSRFFQWLLALALLAGCGGGGGSLVAVIGSGGTGISGEGVGSGGTGAPVASNAAPAGGVGSVSGFGSIIVNGVRFETDTARILLSDTDALKLGMTVRVEGRMNEDLATGVATEVVSAADLRGPVDAIDVANGRFTVLGLTVLAEDSTAYGGNLSGMAGLRLGDLVQVHGLPGAFGKLRATRIERLAAPAAAVLSGLVESLDTDARTLRIGATTVRYGNAVFDALAPASSLAVGSIVRVRAAAFAAVLDAVSVEPWYAVMAADGTRLTLAGQVTSFSSRAALSVDNVPVDASRARVSGGAVGSIVVGASVEVTGTVRDGVLVAERVRLRPAPAAAAAAEPDNFSVSGPVGSFRSVSSFRVRGQQVDATGATFVGGTAAQLDADSRVLVTGPRVVDDVLQAARVEFLR